MKTNKIIKYGWYLILAIPLLIAFWSYKNRPICPDDFKDSKQEIASFYQWLKEYTDKYPNATNSDLANARRDFYIENNCKEALKRHDDFLAGNLDEESQQLIEETIKGESKK